MNQKKYTFSRAMEEEYIEGCSKICSVPYLEEHGDVAFYGSLLTLFGEPPYLSKEYEASFYYTIKAQSEEGVELLLSAYFGPTGPAIGGPTGIELTHEAICELRELIYDTFPSDYDYVGYYLEGPLRIECGIKQGEIYYREEYLEDHEIEEIMQELY